MKKQEQVSNIAHFRQQQALAAAAARLGLSGLASVAAHERITARMEHGAERILMLVREGKQQEALALMSTTTWSLNENEGSECGDA